MQWLETEESWGEAEVLAYEFGSNIPTEHLVSSSIIPDRLFYLAASLDAKDC